MEISRVHHDFNDPKLDDAVFWMFLKEMKNCQVFLWTPDGKMDAIPQEWYPMFRPMFRDGQ